MFLFSYSFKPTVEESNARQTGYQLNINPSGSPKASYSAIPIPPPSLPSLNRRHFKPNATGIDLTITRTSRHVWISPQECIQDPCMTCENLPTWKRKDGKQQQDSTLCGWSTPPRNWWAVYSATVDAPDGGNITGKSHYHRATRSQLTSRTGRTFKRLLCRSKWRILLFWYNLFIQSVCPPR